jgi:23S rRNA G2445 N2-methylase RlmL
VITGKDLLSRHGIIEAAGVSRQAGARMARLQTLRITCAPGLEGLLAEELTSFGFAKLTPSEGAVQVAAPLSAIPQLHRSRIGSRVWLTIARANVHNKAQLAAMMGSVRWGKYRVFGEPLQTKLAAVRSALWHSEMVDEVMRAEIDPSSGDEEGGTRLLLRIDRDRATLRLDCSGNGLHRRGYRVKSGSAPLREDLAAGCLAALAWTPAEALLDPCCGTGTFVIEAARIAFDRPPRSDWAFTAWPCFRSIETEAAPVPGSLEVVPLIFGSDSDPRAVDSATLNAEKAGVLTGVELLHDRAQDRYLDGLPAQGLALFNPPYGVRIHGSVIGTVRRRLAEKRPDWRMAVLWPSDREAPWPDAQQVLSFRSGGLGVTLWGGPVR